MFRRPRLPRRVAIAAALPALLAITAVASGGRPAAAQTPPPPAAASQTLTDADAVAASKLAIRRELEAVNAAMTAAFNRGDYLAAARFYTDDAQIIGPGGVRVTGRAGIDRYWTSLPAGSTWKLDVLDAGGSAVSMWQLGRSTLVMPSRAEGGAASTSVVDFVAIWQRQPDRSLKLYIDMYVPAPRPAAGR
jgi:ketosteroid isomerase-like protein